MSCFGWKTVHCYPFQWLIIIRHKGLYSHCVLFWMGNSALLYLSVDNYHQIQGFAQPLCPVLDGKQCTAIPFSGLLSSDTRFGQLLYLLLDGKQCTAIPVGGLLSSDTRFAQPLYLVLGLWLETVHCYPFHWNIRKASGRDKTTSSRKCDRIMP